MKGKGKREGRVKGRNTREEKTQHREGSKIRGRERRNNEHRK